MADIRFNYEMQSAFNNLESNLLEITLDTIRGSQMGITDKIIDSIRDNTRRYREYLADNISDSRIENRVEKYFEELKTLEKNHVSKIMNSIEQATGTIMRLVDKKSIRQLESIFTTLTNEIINHQNPILYENLNRTFESHLGPFLTSFYLYNSRIEGVIFDVQREVKYILYNYCEELIEEFKSNLTTYLKNYRERIIGAIEEQLKENNSFEEQEKDETLEKHQEVYANNNLFVSSDDIRPFMSLANKMGIKIEDTFDGYMIKTSDGENSEMLYKDESNTLHTKDYSIELLKFGDEGVKINVGDRTVCETKDTCYFGTREDPYKIELISDFIEYKIKYAGKIETDPIKKGVILTQIAKYHPDFYSNLSNDIMFTALEQEVEQADKEIEELYKDFNGKLHITEKNREKFLDKLSAIGYLGVEKDDGVYVVDRQGVEHKLCYESNYAFLEDEPTHGFNTNFYIIKDNEIKGPQIDYHVDDINLLVAANYLEIALSGPTQYYYVGYNSNNKFKIMGKLLKGNVWKDESHPEILSSLQKNSPEAFEKVKNACLEFELAQKNQANTVEVPKQEEAPITNQEEIVQEGINQTEELMEELDGDNKVEQEYNTVDISEMSEDSINNEIEMLKEDPNVQRYIALMEEIKSRTTENNARQFK